MDSKQSHLLGSDALKIVFIQQLSILYSAKVHLTLHLPYFIEHSSFYNLKLALEEDMEDNRTQLIGLTKIFEQMNEQRSAEGNFGVEAIITEARKQVFQNRDSNFASDMSIIMYMGVIENLQLGAGRILNTMACSPKYLLYAQLIKECLDITKDNARLFQCIAEEYIEPIS
jgi:ferritin-like metal-binding protein YciE